MTYLTNSLFLCDYWSNSDGFFAEEQIISESFKILNHIQITISFVTTDPIRMGFCGGADNKRKFKKINHIQISSQFWTLLMLKVWL